MLYVCPHCKRTLDIAAYSDAPIVCPQCGGVFTMSRPEIISAPPAHNRKPSHESMFEFDDVDDTYDRDVYVSRRRDRHKDGVGLAVASMVLGITGLVLMMCFWPVGVVCAVLAVVIGAVHSGRNGREMAIAGIVCGAIGIALLVLIFLGAIGFAAFRKF